jgi:hypothetical protein
VLLVQGYCLVYEFGFEVLVGCRSADRRELSFPDTSVGFFFALLSDLEDGLDVLLENVELSPIYTALQSRRPPYLFILRNLPLCKLYTVSNIVEIC